MVEKQGVELSLFDSGPHSISREKGYRRDSVKGGIFFLTICVCSFIVERVIVKSLLCVFLH